MTEVKSEETRPSKNGPNTTLIIAFIILSMMISALVYVQYIDKIGSLNDQISTLTASIQKLNDDLLSSKTQIAALNNKLSQLGSNKTSSPDISLVYNETKDSVVLIYTNLGQGSGFIYDTLGHIITNYHVIEGATSIKVTFINGTVAPAIIIGSDPYADLAVIKVDAPVSLLKPLVIGSSAALIVGDPVIAIGNPYGLADTVTHGIISAKGREFDEGLGYLIIDVLQTDAIINPGNSGGPLLNMLGEVVGINTGAPNTSSVGIYYAIPSDTITRELPSLIATGHYDQPYLGISGTDVTTGISAAMGLPSSTHGTLVISTMAGGPAANAGLKGGNTVQTIDGVQETIGGDIIVSADGVAMKDFYNLRLYIQTHKKAGNSLSLDIIRNESNMTLTVILGIRPAPS